MVITRNVCISIAAIVSLSGCTSFIPSSAYKDYAVQPLSPVSVKGKQKNISDMLTELGFPSEQTEACQNELTPSDNCKVLRNQIVATLVMASEEICLAHRMTIYGNDAAFNITSGTLTNFFSGWAAVAPSAHGKSILAALALFSNSERSLVNELIYKSVVVAAVDKKILQIRESKANQLKQHFTDATDAYPLQFAIFDVLAFHRSCSFIDGLEKAVEEGTQETPQQKAARLSQNLQVLAAQINSYKSIPPAGTDPVYDALKARIASLKDEIIILEKQ